MQEKDLEKFIVFVESMRTGDNDLEVDVILEGLFNVYGNKSQFTFNDRASAMKTAMHNPNQVNRIWPKVYANNPEILLAALQHPDVDKAKVAYEFMRQFIENNSSGDSLGSAVEKGIQKALKNSPELNQTFKSFLAKRVKPTQHTQVSRNQGKVIEDEWAESRKANAKGRAERAAKERAKPTVDDLVGL